MSDHDIKTGGELKWRGDRTRRIIRRASKRWKARIERRKAKRNHEAQATYNRYHGYAD